MFWKEFFRQGSVFDVVDAHVVSPLCLHVCLIPSDSKLSRRFKPSVDIHVVDYFFALDWSCTLQSYASMPCKIWVTGSVMITVWIFAALSLCFVEPHIALKRFLGYLFLILQLFFLCPIFFRPLFAPAIWLLLWALHFVCFASYPNVFVVRFSQNVVLKIKPLFSICSCCIFICFREAVPLSWPMAGGPTGVYLHTA